MEYLIALLISVLAFVVGYQLFCRGAILRSRAASRLAAAYEVQQVLASADPRSLKYKLAAAGIQTENPHLTWAAITWLPAAITLVTFWGAGFPLAVTVGASVIALVAPRKWLDGRIKERGRRIDQQLPAAYARLVAMLRANVDVAAALREVAESLEMASGPTPLSTELRHTAMEATSTEIGREKALRNLQQRSASTSLANLGLLLERFTQTGAGQGGRFYEAFERAAQNVQGILEARLRAKAKAAEQLQSARIVPILLAGTMLFFMNDPGFRISFQVPLVQVALALAVAMMYAGYTIMADITREAV
jgi:Flp pilus assembly protein TadB